MDRTAQRLLDEIEQFVSEHGRDSQYSEAVDALERASAALKSDPEHDSPGRQAAREAAPKDDREERRDDSGGFRGRVFALAEHRSADKQPEGRAAAPSGSRR